MGVATAGGKLGCHMRRLQVVRIGIVIFGGVLGMLNGGVGNALQSQQPPAPARASGSNQALVDAIENVAD